MRKKGKYKLFSFEIDKSLIFFRCTYNERRLIAFSILKLKSLNSIMWLLNQLIIEDLIKYYSIQLPFSRTSKFIIVLQYRANEIVQLTSQSKKIESRILNQLDEVNFLKGENLKQEFFKVIPGITKNTSISFNKNSLVVHTGKITHFIEIQKVCIDEKKVISFLILQKLIQKYEISGYLLLNFKKDERNNVIFAMYLFLRRNLKQLKHEIREDINKFFKNNILETFENKFNIILCFWRESLFKEYNKLEFFKKFLNLDSSNFVEKLHYFNLLERNLKKNKIEYHIINKNILLINNKILFLIYDNLNFEDFNTISQKFTNRYEIYLLLVNDQDYVDLKKENSIKYEKFKIIDGHEFNNLDFKNI